MLTIYSDDHHLHDGRSELMDGQLMPCFDMPARADHVLHRVLDRNLGPVDAPQVFGLGPILRGHERDLLDFFKGAWAR
ncbi:histone deacetylase family protein, partial [Pseudomonas sp. Dout3]|nr:histone deacetylase family protein [Pseudomonas sp. Dout3]